MTITYDPHHPQYLDETDVRGELTRVFDLCQGCRMSVRPMQYIVIQREEGIVRCAQCPRYLYLGSWLSDDAASLEAGENGPVEGKKEG